ncbi:potassium channel family protein [Rhodococcus maanshanensis]|uniref:potassium channel family protein n=1 Tax=Rhodococcus maanshanensis TaxID=183556 RepID=UPI0022B3BE79|nr:potassium channel family protein [Rhodococcus maanshanensis]MCZ4554817.1 potassium channel family protein [Rhodococcus maanshanensis]
MVDDRFENMPKEQRRRLIRRVVIRTLLSAAALVVVYFVIPMQNLESASAIGGLVLGLVFVGGLFTWQIRKIVRAEHPGLQAIEGLGLMLPGYLLAFATLYHLMSVSGPENFNEPLTKIDSLYFTLVCFSTVGFGDITATTEVSRAIVSAQIVGNLFLIAVGVRIITAAVRMGQRRKGAAT